MLRQMHRRWRLFRFRVFGFSVGRRRAILNVLALYVVVAILAGAIAYIGLHPRALAVISHWGRQGVSWLVTDGWEMFPRLVQRIPISETTAQSMLRQAIPLLKERETAGDDLRISEAAVRDILAMVTNYDLQQPASFLEGQIPVISVAGWQLTSRGEEDSPGQRPSVPAQAQKEAPNVTITAVPRDPEPPSVPQQPSVPEPPPAVHEPVLAPEARRREFASFYRDSRPLVGIYHTHTGETYRTHDNLAGKSYAWDNYKPAEGPIPGVVQAGVVIAEELRNRYHIPVIHSTRIHDYPVWSRAYANSLQTAREMAQQNSQLRLLIDLHRDEGRTTKVIGGRQLVQVLLVVAAGTEDLPHPRWQENLELAKKINAKFEALYPGLSRELGFAMTAGSINTFIPAQYCWRSAGG